MLILFLKGNGLHNKTKPALPYTYTAAKKMSFQCKPFEEKGKIYTLHTYNK